MSNLRRKTRVPASIVEEEDVEAHVVPKKYNAVASPSAASSALLATGSPHRPHKNPALLARRVLREFLYLLKYEDVGGIATPGGVVTLMQEMIVSFTLGILAVSMFIFLDYKDVIHLQTTHKYQNETYQLMRDPTTRTSRRIRA